MFIWTGRGFDRQDPGDVCSNLPVPIPWRLEKFKKNNQAMLGEAGYLNEMTRTICTLVSSYRRSNEAVLCMNHNGSPKPAAMRLHKM